MNISQQSLLYSLLLANKLLRPQVYFKASLIALSHAMEDLVIVGNDKPLVIANFQHERFYRQETRRYARIARRSDQVYVMAAPDSELVATSNPYEVVPFDPKDDFLAQEWHLVIVAQKYSACIVCREFSAPVEGVSFDELRQFKGIWTFDRATSKKAAVLLLERILDYQPQLAQKVELAKQRYGLNYEHKPQTASEQILEIDARLFTGRLVNYLQSSQYKQLKSYRTILQKETFERLINRVTAFIRNSLDSEEILTSTVRELGRVFSPCRCIFYHYPADKTASINYECVADVLPSMKGENWLIANHPLFQNALEKNHVIAITDASQDLGIQAHPELSDNFQRWQICSCLLIPIRYQESWLGILEIHHCGNQPYIWNKSERTFVEVIATQVAIALMQSQAYRNLEKLNRRLADLERTQSNLIAIVGHELRTPLSTIQICLETLALEENIPLEVQQTMLDTALGDSERMGRLIGDFLTLSKLEANTARSQLEATSLQESLSLVLGSVKRRNLNNSLPQIVVDLPSDLPLVLAEREGIMEVLSKLLDNACKFTPSDGQITVSTRIHKENISQEEADKQLLSNQLEVVIKDTGRGIEPVELERIFQRFYQEENFLQRSIGGTGLGLAICRQIIQKLGGQIWATSNGKNQGSEFHFTLPIADTVQTYNQL
ncbi:histidine kinase,histidine kinase,GAF domain-containing protein [Rivularia sp. PCC 7116]|uniref:DICT sensory domain-containing protein n=1 Tax=Rivularia sp. PCC 7116 TaxID=373994 RepID=UPI00029F4C16|nr:DICT sensory domain-containing protein [Rivularia sp. PCC 7116]AFY55316.1 histidine kinase,histidine kinase,GAF domain-containing protein [Rivularia sp. PCC 7116]